MRSECYMYLEGYGSRDLRGLSELLICWACRDKLDEYGFYEDPSCREEGLRGPLGEAEDALRHMHMHMCMCCLLYTSPSPRDPTSSRMPSSA